MAISDAQRRAVAKYNAANYDRVELRLEKGKKEITKAHAEAQGESLNAFINRAISETMERDNAAIDKSPMVGYTRHRKGHCDKRLTL